MGIVVLPGEPYMKSCSESCQFNSYMFIFSGRAFAGGFSPDVRGPGPGPGPWPGPGPGPRTQGRLVLDR